MPDELAALGELTKTPDANIIKLPNVSASIPQLKECIQELQAAGFELPSYPENPKTDEEKGVQARYAKILGSAVNPVLREGNSDRRAAVPVKNYAKKYPHKMGPWSGTSKSHVAHMTEGDFYANEQSVVLEKATSVRIEFESCDGNKSVLKKDLKLEAAEVLDGTFMSKKALRAYYEREMEDCKKQGILLSLHLKATMMKISDPIIFGHAVTVFFKDVFEKHAATLKQLGAEPNEGFGAVLKKISTLPESEQQEILADIDAAYAARPKLAMVDSNRGITNLHVPSDIIVDASMPSMIRGMDGLGGGMWCPDSSPGAKDSHLCDTKALIPDRCYAGVFKETIEFCKANGAFDPATMGSVPNVGLMAKKAEEYGSHDKTFQAPGDGVMRVVDAEGNVLVEHKVEEGDIWRACQTKDVAIKDWVRLAVARARATGWPAVFWLDDARAHDRNIKGKVQKYLLEHDTAGLEILFLNPVEACRHALERAKQGESTISVTGNVLRDYNTDLFPILELGTSAKMLSIVPLLAGGGMYETGAGGSAPKHVQQFVKENHLRWDSLGEFLALQANLEELGTKTGDSKVAALAAGLDSAVGRFLDSNKNPSRKVKELDNRGSHFYLALYWAEAMAGSENAGVKAEFEPVAAALKANEEKILDELIQCQGSPVDLGGYYKPDAIKAERAMRPSGTLNAIIDGMMQ
uniref:Isocitrate dehydrogenase (NADP(+)) n=1 Tax=Oxyrrhis marina TaxID=2969 RepID=A0A7S4GMT9_OXYMA